MPPITVLIKPASGLCNMRCKYCFYADETSARSIPSYGVMKEETLRAVLTKVLSYATRSCTLAFQGGEPTLAGLPFFQRLLELEEELNVNGAVISHSIQTNGYAVGEEWARFFHEHDFLVGVSLDGDKALHDANRVDAEGRGTYERVMRTIGLFQKHRVKFNILTVVTRQGARRTQKICSFFARSGLDYQQFIPCLDPLGEEPGSYPWSLTPEGMEQHLKSSFDFWHREALAGRMRYHRYFFNLLNIMSGRRAEACDLCGVCARQLVVEADGGVYPCDFYMLDEHRLGNLVTDTLEQIEEKRIELGFVEESVALKQNCRGCRWERLCRGGCRRNWKPLEGGRAENYFCPAYLNFLDYAYPRLQQVLAMLAK